MNVDDILRDIQIVIAGAHEMQRSLQPLVNGTAEHHERLHELPAHDAERLRSADTRLAEALELLGTDALEAAKYIREIVGQHVGN